MTRIEKSIAIDAPVEKVFAFVNDFDNFIKASSLEMEILSRDEGPQRVGFVTKARMKAGGRVWEFEFSKCMHASYFKCFQDKKKGEMLS